MADRLMNFMDFLDDIYGRSASDQIAQVTGLSPEDLRKASDAFAPAFLNSLMQTRSAAPSSSDGLSPGFGNFWPKEMQSAMQSFMEQSLAMASKAGDTVDAKDFPFSAFAQQKGPMDQLYQAFMGQAMQAGLSENVSRTTGIPKEQLKSLFPLLTTYGLIPLMPPSLDDPAGWVDYLGDMGRRKFRQANRELDAMPSPVAAAFDGLLAGFFPNAVKKEPTPAEQAAEKAEEKIEEFREASLEMQTHYIKGLNSLFESYQAGLAKDPADKE